MIMFSYVFSTVQWNCSSRRYIFTVRYRIELRYYVECDIWIDLFVVHLTVVEAAGVINEICKAIEFLHTGDIAHRDLKVIVV